MNIAFLKNDVLLYTCVLGFMALVLFMIPKNIERFIFFIFLALKFILTAFFIYFLIAQLTNTDMLLLLLLYFSASAGFWIIHQHKQNT